MLYFKQNKHYHVLISIYNSKFVYKQQQKFLLLKCNKKIVFFTVLGMKDSLSFVLNKMEELMTNANGLQEQNTVDTDSPT